MRDWGVGKRRIDGQSTAGTRDTYPERARRKRLRQTGSSLNQEQYSLFINESLARPPEYPHTDGVRW